MSDLEKSLEYGQLITHLLTLGFVKTENLENGNTRLQKKKTVILINSIKENCYLLWKDGVDYITFKPLSFEFISVMYEFQNNESINLETTYVSKNDYEIYLKVKNKLEYA